MITACTVIAANYQPFARVLAESFFAQHPGGTFVLLLIDDEGKTLVAADRRLDVRRLEDLRLPRDEITRLAGIYDVTELATAVKPLLLRTLLDEGHEVVVYLDPDIRLYAALQPVVPLARTHGIVLTPHTTAPYPRDGRQVDAAFILSAGIYNLGFLAVGAAARPFLDWWWEATRREALVDIARMMFTDQRLVDFVPGFYDHCILRDPGYNVAYWNLHERRIAAGPAGSHAVNGLPLRFFHFSGFDPRRPWLLSKHQGERPRILLSERPEIAAICAAYAAELHEHGGAAPESRSYGWSRLPSGTEITLRMRRVYWAALVAAEREGQRLPPNPFDHGDAFVDWLNDPEPGGPPLSRYLLSIYRERPDLQVHFRDLAGADAGRFADWIWRQGIEPERIPAELMPAAGLDQVSLQAAASVPLVNGVAIAADQDAPGAGLSIRLLASALTSAGEPWSLWPERALEGGPPTPDGRDSRQFDIALVAVDDDSGPGLVNRTVSGLAPRRYTVAYCSYAAGQVPKSLSLFADRVDEVWTHSAYAAEDIRRALASRPVFTVPLPFAAMATSEVQESAASTDRFTFLFRFDCRAGLERPNPLGLIEAFARAFTAHEGPGLVIEMSHAELRASVSERVRLAARGHPDILLVEAGHGRDPAGGVPRRCDCYISLHRADGLGAAIAEAMALGTPVIATATPALGHFLNPGTAYLVESRPAPMSVDGVASAAPGLWAEPDLDRAARLMRELVSGGPEIAVRAARGRAIVKRQLGAEAAAAAVAARLAAIRAERSARLADVQERRMSEDLADERTGEPSAADRIEALLPRLEHLAVPRLGAPTGRFGGMRLAAQRALFRVLRPYWFQQVEFQQAVVTGLRHVGAALRREQRNREAFEHTVRELTRGVVRAEREHRRGEPSKGGAEARPASPENGREDGDS